MQIQLVSLYWDARFYSTLTARKTIFSFSRRPEKMVFPKKSRWNMIFLVLLGKIMFLFLENMILTLGGKWKMIFFKKIQGNMIFSSGPPKRRSFQERPRRDMIFFVLSGKMVFFSRKHDIFSWAGNQRQLFSRNTWKYFLCTRVGVTGLVSRPPAKKNQGWPYPAKIHLKVIDVLDWHPGKSSSKSL